MGDYRDTLNLPQTSFSMRANLKKKEPVRIEDWLRRKIYYKMLEKRRGKQFFILHDGPPYSNEHLHMGHALNKILKDILVKYKALRGYYTPFIPGWDNHGMPIENAVIKNDPELQRISQDPDQFKRPEVRLKIRRMSREFAKKWVEIQREEFIRLGVFADWDNPYLTMDYSYEAEELRIFADFVEMGYIYRGTMPIHWCPTCRTALAMVEIEYKEKKSPSIYFRFPIKDDKRGIFDGKTGYALVWTTTPWTIISNIALAFNPVFDYVVVEKDGELYLLAEALLEKIKDELEGFEDIKVIKKLKGSEIEGSVFAHPFIERESLAILGEFVTLEEGTGIVHIAPGHGREDFEVGQKYNLPVLSPVDERGIFTEEAHEFKGLDIESASKRVVEVLKEKGHLLKEGEVLHSYPHCWRCKNPLIFRATSQWFLRVDHNDLRKKALFEIDRVKWHPPDSKNRMYASVKERPDWVLSRQRAWGVNIPAFYCKNCGHVVLDPAVIRHVADIFEEKGSDAWYELSVDELLPPGYKCPKCGSRDFEKEMDILDVWFDSGSTNLIVLKEDRGLEWPSDVYLEGPDQHRGWFNASLMIGVAKRGRAPYRAVITHGWTLDEQGRAMHKSLGNVISPLEIAEKYGAEILRLWVSQSDYTEDMRLGGEIIDRTVESYRKIRNTIRFMLSNLYDFNPVTDSIPYRELFPLEKYILYRFEEVKKDATRHMDSFEIHRMFHRVLQFTVVDLSSFYLDVLKDRLYTWAKNSKGRRSAQTAIYEILRELLILYAPLLSFTAEEAWEHLPGEKEESVFLADWPEVYEDRIDEELKKEFDLLMDVRERVLLLIERARKEEKILNDRLEAKVHIYPKDKELQEVLYKYKDMLYEFFIVSQVELQGSKPDLSLYEEDERVYVGIEHASGKKCARCWIWSEKVGEDDEHPELCPKCVRALRGEEYDYRS